MALLCLAAWRRVLVAVLCSMVLLSDFRVECTELTINLQEREKQCFYEYIDLTGKDGANSKFTLDFQVSGFWCINTEM